jgi:hypothetical protein
LQKSVKRQVLEGIHNLQAEAHLKFWNGTSGIPKPAIARVRELSAHVTSNFNHSCDVHDSGQLAVDISKALCFCLVLFQGIRLVANGRLSDCSTSKATLRSVVFPGKRKETSGHCKQGMA